MLQPGHRHYVLSSYRTLLQLIARLPQVQRQSALAEARATCKERKHDTNPEKTLTHLKELAARIGYLRIVTPRRPGDASREAGKFVLRDGKLVEGEGEEKGSRCVPCMAARAAVPCRPCRQARTIMWIV